MHLKTIISLAKKSGPQSYSFQIPVKFIITYVLILLYVFVASPYTVSAHDDPDSEIERLSHQIKESPDNSELYLRRGELLRITEKPVDALADLLNVLRLEPDHDMVYFYLGRLRFETGQYRPALSALNTFLISHPGHVGALIIRGRTMRKISRPLDAVEDYKMALELASKHTPVMYLERAEALVEAGDQYIGEAVRGLDEGMQRLGSLVVLQIYAIDLRVRQGNYGDALFRIDSVMKDMKRKERWLYRRGEVLELAGRTDEAHAAYKDAMEALDSLPERLKRIPASRELRSLLRAALKGEINTQN
jgi:tetratricopeptide (TPR) repeat protein